MFKKLFQLKELLLSVFFIFAILVSTTALAETSSSPSIENSIVIVSLQVGKRRGGTAFYIGEGRFVTNFHVVYGLTSLFKNANNFVENIYVRYDDKKIPIKEILYLDALNDLAVLKVSSKDISLLEERMKPLEIQSSIELQLDSGYKVIVAIVMDYTAQIPKRRQFFINPESLFLKDGDLRFPENTKPGMSGSPILLDNKVIGVIKSGLEFNTFATPSTDLFALLKKNPLFCKNTSCIKAELESLKTKAQNGDVSAQYNLGIFYYNEGRIEEAKKWFLKAAAQGYVKAQYNLGFFYYNEGRIEEAKKWVLKAAAQGYVKAQFGLGVVYDNEDNKEEAKKWFLKAAAQGHVKAQFNLGILYYDEGRIEESEKWYLKAAAQGYVKAQFGLGFFYYNEGRIEESEKWYLKAAAQEHTNAQYNSGILYEDKVRIEEAKKFTFKNFLKKLIKIIKNSSSCEKSFTK